MRKQHDMIEITVISREESFLALEQEWDGLMSRCQNPSFFSSFDFVRTAWEHFSSGKKDRLLILVLKRNADIIAIAPFRIGILKGKPFPIRVIRMIPEWNGDKPRILTCENEAIVWESVFKFFKYDFKDWDKIDLAEIVFGGGTKINHEVIEIIGCRCTIKPETVSCSIATRGWDDYISGLSKNTKRMLKRNESKLSRLPTTAKLQCYKLPEDINDCLNRFVNIEQSGWKKEKPFTIGGNRIQFEFYKQLFMRLAQKKMVSFFFLSASGQDISAEIVYHCKHTSYLAHTTYNEEFAWYSPGVSLDKRVIQNLMRSDQYKEIDMLGMQAKFGNQEHKKKFATTFIKTYRVILQKRNFRWLLNALGGSHFGAKVSAAS